MTRGEISGRVIQWLGLQKMDDYDETGLVDDLIYRGTIDLLTRTRCVARCVHLHYVANQAVYTLDHSILAMIDVDDGATRRARRDQTGVDDVPGVVVYPAGATQANPFTFTLIRADLLRLNPTPTSAGQVDVWAVLLPTKMANDTDSLSSEQFGAIPEEFQDAIELYTLWKAADYTDDASSGVGERYRMLYEGQDGRGGRIVMIKQQVNKRGTARVGPRRVSLQAGNARDTWVA